MEKLQAALEKARARRQTEEGAPPPRSAANAKPAAVVDMPLFAQAPEHPVVDELRKLDLNQMTPMQAFDLIRQWQDELNASTEHEA